MNTISTIQNEPTQLERLAAQRELYSAAKKIHVIQIISTVLLPVGLSITGLLNKDWTVVSAIYGFVIFILDVSVLEPAIKRHKTKAAKIQELFDCAVLQLDKSPLKTVDDIAVEDVLHHYNAHAKISSNIEKIRDWYPAAVSQLPLEIARVVCQRSNCRWDSALRIRYSLLLKIIGFTVSAIILLIGYLTDLSLIRLTLIAGGLVPFFRFCIKNCNENSDAAQRLNELIAFSRKLWFDAIAGKCTEKELKEGSRRLQDEIFEHRRRSPLILDVFYNLYRNRDEQLMNISAEKMIEEALRKS